ncbi:MAG: hypothetical protein ICV77_07170 [Cyanobacteria bacterium Co-bin8]|nr:hypothetical protein [Cyanobacteria bacterium Co-bin8]
MTDPAYERQINRLRDVMMRRWWIITGLLWLVVAPLCLWHLRDEIALLRQYFTWTAVRYGLAYNRLSALGLSLCVGMTVALLMAESRHILFGLSTHERERLEKQLGRIRQKGPRHPLWRQICEE